MQPKLLVVDDDKNLREVLNYNLRREGYRTLTAAYGKEAIHLAYTEQPDLIILDVMLPDVSGLEVCRIIRRQLSMPVLMLSARAEEVDKLLGLELGADDYLTKPFSFRELLARVHAQLRRVEMLRGDQAKPLLPPSISMTIDETASNTPASPGGEATLLVVGELLIDLAHHNVKHKGRTVIMTPREFDLLAFLARYPMKVFSRQELLNRVWGYNSLGGTRTVDVHIRGLRAKLESDPTNPQLIQTIYNVGYKFNQPVVAQSPA